MRYILFMFSVLFSFNLFSSTKSIDDITKILQKNADKVKISIPFSLKEKLRIARLRGMKMKRWHPPEVEKKPNKTLPQKTEKRKRKIVDKEEHLRRIREEYLRWKKEKGKKRKARKMLWTSEEQFFLGLGILLEMIGEKRGAIAHYQKIMEKYPDRPVGKEAERRIERLKGEMK